MCKTRATQFCFLFSFHVLVLTFPTFLPFLSLSLPPTPTPFLHRRGTCWHIKVLRLLLCTVVVFKYFWLWQIAHRRTIHCMAALHCVSLVWPVCRVSWNKLVDWDPSSRNRWWNTRCRSLPPHVNCIGAMQVCFYLLLFPFLLC